MQQIAPVNDYSDLAEFDAVLRQDLSSLTAKAFHTVDPQANYLPNWHIDLICEHLVACYKRDIKRLVINMPPRNLKSIAASVAFPAWVLGHQPSERIMSFSYSMPLALDHNVSCRTVMEQAWYQRAFPNTRLKRGETEKRQFHTTMQGAKFATSFTAGTIGFGGNILIIDDPHDPDEALDDKQREKAIQTFRQKIMNRLNDKKNGVVILIMQRLHEGDLSGFLLEEMGGWEHLCIPATAKERQVITFGDVNVVREIGDIMHPEREGPKELKEQERTLNSKFLFGYESQYQQNPVPMTGGIIDLAHFRRYRSLPVKRALYERKTVHSWDTAASEDGDFSCMGRFICDPPKDPYLDLVKREQMLYPALKKAVIAQARADNPDLILIENKSSGQQLIQELTEETDLPVVEINPVKDKVLRFSSAAAYVEYNPCWLPIEAEWLDEFEAEILQFPKSTYKDQADMWSQFINYIRDYNMFGVRGAQTGRKPLATARGPGALRAARRRSIR